MTLMLAIYTSQHPLSNDPNALKTVLLPKKKKKKIMNHNSKQDANIVPVLQ